MMGVGYLGGLLTPTIQQMRSWFADGRVAQDCTVLWILWRGRRARTWSIGVTDLMLMGAPPAPGLRCSRTRTFGTRSVGPPTLPGFRSPIPAAVCDRRPCHLDSACRHDDWLGAISSQPGDARECSVGTRGRISDHAANNYAVPTGMECEPAQRLCTGYGMDFDLSVRHRLHRRNRCGPVYRAQSSAAGSWTFTHGFGARAEAFWTAMLLQRMLAFLYFHFRREPDIDPRYRELAAHLHDSMSPRDRIRRPVI